MKFIHNETCLDLTGQWSFAMADQPLANELRSQDDVVAAGLALYPCTVPGNLELDLQAVGLFPEPFYGMNMVRTRELERAHVWYTRRFKTPAEWQGSPELVFEGLDCFADIYLNGQWVASTDNMLVEQVIPVPGLQPGENELLVHIRPAHDEAQRYAYPPALNTLPSNYDSLYVRKAPHMYGWDIMPRALSAGIWRPVALTFRAPERIEYVYLETQEIAEDRSVARMALHYHAHTRALPADRYELRLVGRCGDSVFEEHYPMLFEAGAVRFQVADPALWWPRGRGEAHLYRCEASLWKNGVELDRCTFSTGIRTVALERTSVTDQFGSGAFGFRVNGERIFVHGSNWVPVDAFHSRDAERIPSIIAMAEDLNCNMFRCWGGNVYENDLFYELCDAKGILVWQDFAMACAVYPQDTDFCQRFEREARQVVRRLRQHPCIALWAGDNECDWAYSWGGRSRDPNNNVLTRQVLPRVLQDEDQTRPYLPSSPYIDPVAYKQGDAYLPEHHLWGPRDYYKSNFYRNSMCHFASEMGYHGCPAPTSIRRFISPEKVWPYQDNEEWTLHATSPVPGVDLFDYRVELMAKQVRELFGQVPTTLEPYALASQISQAEAKKFFIELFRSSKWRRTGILWWNLMDGWPQFSDAIVDYYYTRKLAYWFIRRVQTPLCLMFKEPSDWKLALVASNDTRQSLAVTYRVRDVDTDAVVVEGCTVCLPDAVTPLSDVPFSMGQQRFYSITWESELGQGCNHYVAGNPPFALEQYMGWLRAAGLVPEEWLTTSGFDRL